ncbi:MAG TPA: twin-arginine translocation pathway signal protein [Dehalococcoidia bacterium]|nr:twin-arginine translocation pathway signal protein [Dehalococcoidia bacterium]
MTKRTNQKRRISRRETLVLMGGAALAVTVGCGDDSRSETPADSATASSTPQRTTAATTTASTQTATAAPVACVVTPEQTEGPYFVDEMLNRSDITSDPADGSVSDGVPLRLTLTVSSVNGTTCTPAAGANVDMWHCDADGVYSDVSGGAGQPDTSGQRFLRGYQVSDQNGQVVFQTIFPGWYSGRTPHIHFKVRTIDGLESSRPSSSSTTPSSMPSTLRPRTARTARPTPRTRRTTSSTLILSSRSRKRAMVTRVHSISA